MTTIIHHIDQNVQLINFVGFFEHYRYPKALLRFPLDPAVLGKTPTAARLKLYQESAFGTLDDVEARSAIGAWAPTDSAASLGALALSAALSTQSLSSDLGWKTFDVLGDTDKGAVYACQQSLATITLAVLQASLGAPMETGANIELGVDLADTNTYRSFTKTGANQPVLEIDVEGVTTILAMSAGVVV